MQQVFQEVYMFAQQKSEDVVTRAGLRKSDITECAEILRQAYACERMDEREGLIAMGVQTL